MRGVVVDGIGCGGKTDLITALKVELKKVGGYDVRELDHVECESQFVRYLREYAAGDCVLFHRSHISEQVFGRVLRKARPFSPDELSALDCVLTARYMCLLAEPPGFAAFVERMGKRPTRRTFSEGEYDDVIGKFREAFKTVPHMTYVSSSWDELVATSCL